MEYGEGSARDRGNDFRDIEHTQNNKKLVNLVMSPVCWIRGKTLFTQDNDKDSTLSFPPFPGRIHFPPWRPL